jgi:hypothetical protein
MPPEGELLPLVFPFLLREKKLVVRTFDST